MDWRERLISNPDISHGRVCIKGTRIMVSVILDNLSEGLTIDDIIAEYPPLEKEDVLAAINYAAELAKERIIPFDKLVTLDFSDIRRYQSDGLKYKTVIDYR